MGVTEAILEIVKPVLQESDKGKSRRELVDHVLSVSKGSYSHGQITGALESNTKVGRLVKVYNGSLNMRHHPQVCFTLPDLEATKALPRVPSCFAERAKAREEKAQKPPKPSGAIKALGELSISDSILTLVETRPELTKPELIEFGAKLLSVNPKSVRDSLWRMGSIGKLVSVGPARSCRFLLTGGKRASEFTFNDDDIIRLARYNPNVKYQDFLSLLATPSGKGHSGIYNQVARLISDGRMAVVDGLMQVKPENLGGFNEAGYDSRESNAIPVPSVSGLEVAALMPKASHTAPPSPPVPQVAPLPDLGALIQGQITNMAASISQTLANQIAAGLASALAQMQPAPAAQPAIPEVKVAPIPIPAPPRKVAIVGLMGAQTGLIASEFPGIHFDFIEAQAISGGRAGEVIKGADKVYSMTKFISHTIENQVKGHPHYERISGGITSLRDAVRRYMLA